mgnify:CR=1 FL=1
MNNPRVGNILGAAPVVKNDYNGDGETHLVARLMDPAAWVVTLCGLRVTTSSEGVRFSGCEVTCEECNRLIHRPSIT